MSSSPPISFLPVDLADTSLNYTSSLVCDYPSLSYISYLFIIFFTSWFISLFPSTLFLIFCPSFLPLFPTVISSFLPFLPSSFPPFFFSFFPSVFSLHFCIFMANPHKVIIQLVFAFVSIFNLKLHLCGMKLFIYLLIVFQYAFKN